MKTTSVISIISYILWTAALMLYGFSIWGSSHVPGVYLLELSKAYTGVGTDTVSVQIGFLDLCVSPDPRQTDNGASRACVPESYYRDGAEGQELVDILFDVLNIDNSGQNNLEDRSIEQSSRNDNLGGDAFDAGTSGSGLLVPRDDSYNVVLNQLLEIVRNLHEKVFSEVAIIVAFALLFVAGVILVIPLFFSHDKRLNICMLILGLSALLLSFGFMVAGGSVFTTLRTQMFLIEGVDGLIESESDGIAISQGRVSRPLLIGALATNGVFIVLVTITACARNRRAKISDVKIPQWISRMQPGIRRPGAPNRTRRPGRPIKR